MLLGRHSPAAPRLGRLTSSPAGPAVPFRAPAGLLTRVGRRLPQPGRSIPAPRPGAPSRPGWAPLRAPSAGPDRPLPRLGRRHLPAGPLASDSRPGLYAGWAAPRLGSPPLSPAGPDQEDPAWPGFPSRPPLFDPGWASFKYSGWATSVYYSGWARMVLPWPRPDYLHNRPGFTPSGTYSLSGIDSSTLCQSWDASRLGLAHSPPSCAGLGTPLGSDQHIHPLLVSLILRRRIRLMTW
jgi:hypothetical protein